jgi:hypothetical protein
MTNTSMTDTPTSADPATIERDIRRTQDEMSQTVDKLGDQLTMKNLFNALLDKADENGVDAHYLVDGARRNPIALGLIAAGAIWLVSDKNSKFPSMSSGNSTGSGSDEFGSDTSDIHHRDYVSHMSSLEMREGEDPMAYQRRRDLHRATFLMCERKPDEDEGSFRQRLDALTDSFREKRRAWSDSISEAGSSAASTAQQAARSAGQTTRDAASRAQDLYDSNPLIGGILAAAVGAAVGSGIPISRKEQETFGELGSEARDMVSEQKDQLTSKAMEKKDELLDKADQKLQPSSGSQHGEQAGRQPSPRGAAGSPDETETAGTDQPFIISERTS